MGQKNINGDLNITGDLKKNGVVVPATGSVTSVQVQAGTGLNSSQSTAQTSTLNTTISIASGYKLLTTNEFNATISNIQVSGSDLIITRSDGTFYSVSLPASTVEIINTGSNGSPSMY